MNYPTVAGCLAASDARRHPRPVAPITETPEAGPELDAAA